MDEDDFLSTDLCLVTGGTGGRGGLPTAETFAVEVAPVGPTVMLVGGFL